MGEERTAEDDVRHDHALAERADGVGRAEELLVVPLADRHGDEAQRLCHEPVVRDPRELARADELPQAADDRLDGRRLGHHLRVDLRVQLRGRRQHTRRDASIHAYLCDLDDPRADEGRRRRRRVVRLTGVRSAGDMVVRRGALTSPRSAAGSHPRKRRKMPPSAPQNSRWASSMSGGRSWHVRS
jgi:hypothetical protein